jgi:hypothetical protein
MPAMAPHAEPPLLSFTSPTGPGVQAHHHATLAPPSTALVDEDDDNARTTHAQTGPGCRSRRDHARHGRALATRRAASLLTPWTPCLRQAHHRDTSAAPDTRPVPTRDHRRRRRRPHPVRAAAVVEAMRPDQTSPDQTSTTSSFAWTRRTRQHPRLAQPFAGIAASRSTSPQPSRSLARL